MEDNVVGSSVDVVIEYRVLGALEAAADGTVADLGPPKQRALLAILALHANQVVPVDELIDELWGEQPPRHAGHAIQVYVSSLREALSVLTGEPTIVWHAPGYLLAAEPDALDADRAEALVAEGAGLFAAGELSAAAAVLGRARTLWRGRPLADFAYEEFAQPAIRRLTETWLHATELLATVALGQGRPDEALVLAEAVVAEDALRERAREAQLLALYRCGRPAEAIRTYVAFEALLSDELGVEPSRTLRHLAERILVHDPSLDTPDAQCRTPSSRLRNPYKGLRAFREQDADDYFGRNVLVDELLGALADGSRLVTLVGPSGSGKSSVIDAGLIPALRGGRLPVSGGLVVRRLRIDTLPTEDLLAATAGVPPGQELLLVVDQLEQVFVGASDDERGRFFGRLASLATDPAGTRFVAALRADFYDRALADARFARVFASGVVTVLPMEAAGLEAAIVEPARRAGAELDPDLLAELISDTVDRPGALPLLQYVLATLFDRCTDGHLTLDAYRAIGGLRGALTRRAETVFERLDDPGRAAARQVFLRLVRPDGEKGTSRRARVRELSALEIDPVVLSDVLRAFETDRLLTFDRDPLSGDGTVEVAHEALLAEWDRLAGWLDACRLDLRQHAWLTTRVEEWVARGRVDDDLLTGGRLDEYEDWRAGTSFVLTDDERAFLDGSVERRRLEQDATLAREARERSLERRAHRRLLGLIGAVAVVAVAGAWAVVAWPGAAPDIVLVYPGPDQGGIYDSIARGFDQVTSPLDLDVQTVVQDPGDPDEGWPELEARLRRLADQGIDLVVVGFEWSNPNVEHVAAAYPGTLFLTVDYAGDLPNVASIAFRVEEGAYLVGAAAARRSSTGTISVVTESDSDWEWPYVAGFVAGARSVDPEVEVIVSYGYDPFSGPTPDLTVIDVSRRAGEVFRQGADVVFYTGSRSPMGVFDAAYRASVATGRQRWAVARDADWYVVLPLFSTDGGSDVSDWRSHILTSLITRWDVGISAMLGDYVRAELRPGERYFGLAEGGFELAPSGGAIDDLLPELDSLAARIADGDVVVPEVPDDRGPPR